jgi:hypothetical protein
MRKKLWLLFVVQVFVVCTAQVRADSTSSPQADEIGELKTQLAEIQARLEQLEGQQKKMIVEEVNRAVEKKQISAVPESMKWLENVKISGDLRYRYEGIDKQSNGQWGPSINRSRIRARLGLEAKVNDDVNIGFRLGSGSNQDPTTTNQTLGEGFEKKPIWLDLAYFDWHPSNIKGFDFIGGKMPRPFYRVGENQLIWSDNVNPEGLAAKYELPVSNSLKAYISGGGFWVGNPDTAGAAETSLWGIQGYLKNTFEDKSYLLGGMSDYVYGHIKGQSSLQTWWGSSVTFLGNTATTTGKYAYGYDIVEGFVEYGTKIGGFPVAVYGDYAHNTSAPSGNDNAWLIGTTFNKAKDPGSWQIGYDYRDIDSDAVVGQFNDSDFDGGGTGAKGHRFNFTYQLAKNFQFALTYFLDVKKDADKDEYHRLQADLIFMF